jgi:hypothetical protein
MEYHETELEDARGRLAAQGRNPDDYTFDLKFLPPDPDGGGMFTVQYEITATNTATGKALTGIGGIGMGWPDSFEQAVKDGEFD